MLAAHNKRKKKKRRKKKEKKLLAVLHEHFVLTRVAWGTRSKRPR